MASFVELTSSDDGVVVDGDTVFSVLGYVKLDKTNNNNNTL